VELVEADILLAMADDDAVDEEEERSFRAAAADLVVGRLGGSLFFLDFFVAR
jgi:hypothetical protein